MTRLQHIQHFRLSLVIKLATTFSSDSVSNWSSSEKDDLSFNNMPPSNDAEDPWCDPANPRVVDFEQISAAAYKIRDGIIRTPCDVSIALQ